MVPERLVKTRRIEFVYPESDMPKYFVSGDLVMSHVVAVLSSLFPNGEDFFVNSVRNYRDDISDPELKKQVAGFIGQEAIHGREHRAFNRKLSLMGYPTKSIDKRVEILFKGLAAKVMSKPMQLGVTAALEHYTATLAEVLMRDEKARNMIDVDEVRSLLLWHALEESEHKAVAFDVYEHVCGKHWLRVMMMNYVTIGFMFAVIFDTATSLMLDRNAWNLKTLMASLKKLRHSPWLTKDVRSQIRAYNKRGFHPDDSDTREIVEYWRKTLFGSDGYLLERLKGADKAG
ncbi:MAG: metal-dependent hydrolase [Acidimicrobiales bacterium]|nr:metal-dependent hydrolase [Acidimicrobiales bacterium]